MTYITYREGINMKIFGNPRSKAKVRRMVVGAAEDAIMTVAFLGVVYIMGWLFHVIFTALGVA